jgi:hypothetical protein
MAERHAEALAPYRRALAIDPDYPLLRNNLAMAIRRSRGDREEEMSLLERAIAIHPLEPNAWINLAAARRAGMDLAGALDAGKRAVELAPDNALSHLNLAMALKEVARWDDAERHARAACERAPADPVARMNLGLLQLLRGDFGEGWANYEVRWDGSDELRGLRPAFPRPPWQGEPLAGKTLLVYGEQGMGDLIQFCRYIPALAARVHREGGRVVWNSFPQMGELLARNLGRYVDEFTSGGGIESLPPYDYEIPLLSLPLMLGTGGETFREMVPYLRPGAAASGAWRARLAGEKRLKVGLAWTGSFAHTRNPFRSVGAERYARWFGGMDGVAFYSLQPGASGDVAAARAAGLEITDFTSELTTFDDTAALAGELDLVITVCTSVAHLSGALGRPTWVLLDVNPHWVWMTDRRDSPWYPTARLYRQPGFAQWDPVFEEVKRDLAALARSR